jgi:hypothetical protein
MDFQIKKGLSTNLFDEFGNLLITPEEGCWYITIDTFELYACYNGALQAVGGIADFADKFKDLESKIDAKIQTYGYKSALPKKGEVDIIYVVSEENAQYRWSETSL